MAPELQQVVESWFAGAMLFPTILMIVVLLYWAVFTFASFDLDFFDFDFDLDSDLDGSWGSAAGVGIFLLRFLNLGEIPLAIWGSAFAICWWLVSLGLGNYWDTAVPEAWVDIILLMLRNGVIALGFTKVVTHPLRGRFDPVEPNASESLLGMTGEVTSTRVTKDFGRARFDTKGAPLILNIRSTNSDLLKGEWVRIIDFDDEKDLFFVERQEERKN